MDAEERALAVDDVVTAHRVQPRGGEQHRERQREPQPPSEKAEGHERCGAELEQVRGQRLETQALPEARVRLARRDARTRTRGLAEQHVRALEGRVAGALDEQRVAVADRETGVVQLQHAGIHAPSSRVSFR